MSRFSVQTFLFPVPKNFVGEHFCVKQNFCNRKNLWVRWGEGREYHDFLWKKLLSRRTGTFVGEPFCAVFQKLFGSGKAFWQEGGGKLAIFSVENFLYHRVENFRWGNPSVFPQFRVSKIVRDEREGRESRFSIEIGLSHSTEELRQGTILYFTILAVSKKNYG